MTRQTYNKKSILTRLVLGLLLLLIVFASPLSTLGADEDLTTETLKTSNKISSVFDQAYSLEIDEETAIVSVVSSDGDVLWTTNPVDADEVDLIANPINIGQLKSQFMLEYMDSSFRTSTMYAFPDAIALGQFDIEEIDGGYLVHYVLGEAGNSLVLPQAVTAVKMEEYLQTMPEDHQKQVTRNYSKYAADSLREKDSEYLELYPLLAEEELYILRTGVQDFKQEELSEYFIENGYSIEQRDLDHEEVGFFSEDSSASFNVTLSYTLRDGGFEVSVDPSSIEYDTDEYYLVSITLLPYMGAAHSDEDGYLFVPDGSGALIDFDNGKTSLPAYTQRVYGTDSTLNSVSNAVASHGENLEIKMPVFGIKRGNDAILAIIEEGDALASIRADISGKSHSYNHVHARFTVIENGPISSSEMVGTNSMQLFAPKVVDTNFTVRYILLEGEDANYLGMAKAYQDVLLADGALVPLEDNSDLPFAVQFIGAIDRMQSRLGVKYQAITPLTTFADAKVILETLQDRGIEELSAVYTGWSNGGVNSTLPSKIKVVSQLEEDLDQEAFMEDVSNLGIDLYFDVDFQQVRKNKLFDQYVSASMAPRYFDRSIVRLGKIDIVDNKPNRGTIDLLSPVFLEDVVSDFLNTKTGAKLENLAIADLADLLYSDLMPNRHTDRQAAKDLNVAGIEQLSSATNKLMGFNSNVYALGYTDLVLNAPEQSNLYRITDRSIPFYQLVLHGSKHFAGEALNLSEDYEESLLWAAETGGGLHFTWSAADNSAVKDTDFNHLYALNYEAWLDEAVEDYLALNDSVGQLQELEIVSHSYPDPEVARVEYENGAVVYVNYSRVDKTVDETVITARTYKVVGGIDS